MILAPASLLALAALVAHSLRSLPRSRAIAFWCAAALYGIGRGVGVRFVTERMLGARAPYLMHGDALTVGGVPAQEIVGWALVAYLGWWLGWRFSRTLDDPRSSQARARGAEPNGRLAEDRPVREARRGRTRGDGARPRASSTEPAARLFPQVLWACLFLGAIGWSVETAAGAAGWWHWTLPGSPLLLGVPAIGIVDWGFVGIDFVLPFLAITSTALAGRPARWLALGAFPLHFLAHASVGQSSAPSRTLALFLVHAGIFGLVLWLALGSRVRELSFREDVPRAWRWLPLLALALTLGVCAGVETLALGRPALLVSLAPSVLVAAAALAPAFVLPGGAVAAGLSWFSAPFVLAAIPVLGAALVRWAGLDHRARRGAAVLGVAVIAAGVCVGGWHRESMLRMRLDAALEMRDRGDLDGALLALRRISDDFPGSHAPRLLLGEIAYRRGDLVEARDSFAAALAIKPDAAMAHRYLAAIALRQGDLASAAALCERGLERAPGDPDLLHLASLARDETDTRGSASIPVAR